MSPAPGRRPPIPYIPIMNIARAPLRIGKVKGAPKRPIAIADGAFRGWCLQGNGSPGESRGPCWREERAHKGKLRDKEGCGSSAAKRVHVLQRISAVVVTASNRPRSASRDDTPRFSAKRGPVRSITRWARVTRLTPLLLLRLFHEGILPRTASASSSAPPGRQDSANGPTHATIGAVCAGLRLAAVHWARQGCGTRPSAAHPHGAAR